MKAGTNAALLVLQKEHPRAFRLLADYMDAKISSTDFANAKVFKDYDNGWVRKPTPAEKAAMREAESKAIEIEKERDLEL